MLCPKIKEALLEIIRHVEKDNCQGCQPLLPIVLAAKLSPVFRDLMAEKSNEPTPRN